MHAQQNPPLDKDKNRTEYIIYEDGEFACLSMLCMVSFIRCDMSATQRAPAYILLCFFVFHSTLLCTLLLISVYHFLSDDCYSVYLSSPLCPSNVQTANVNKHLL